MLKRIEDAAVFIRDACRYKMGYIAGLFLFMTFSFAYAQERGIGLPRDPREGVGQRLALVIGNSTYKESPLQNPANDAKAIAIALRELGFNVIHRENLSRTDTIKAIQLYGQALRNADVGLFYYAGHGAQVSGRNFIIPVDAVINHEYEVEYLAVDVGLVLSEIKNAGNLLNIVILDACRNNPFVRNFRSSTQGLASIDAPVGTLIAYSTSPGSVASDGNAKNGEQNGIYTNELLKYIREPDLRIEDVFKRVRAAIRVKTSGKQIPWESSALEGDFYFLKSKTVSNSTVRTKHQKDDKEFRSLREVVLYQSGNQFLSEKKYSEAERIFGQLTKDVPNRSDYHNYLGFALFQLERYVEAEAEFRIAVELEPENTEMKYNLASALFRQEHFVEAETVYRQVSTLGINNGELHNDLGTTLFKQGKYADAEAEYRAGLIVEPSYAQLHYNLGNSLFRQGKYQEAEVAYRKAGQYGINSGEFHNDLGTALFDQGKYSEGEIEYELAVKLQPAKAMFWNNLGNSLIRQNKYVDAEVRYRKAVELSPNNLEYQKNLRTAENMRHLFADPKKQPQGLSALFRSPVGAQEHTTLLNLGPSTLAATFKEFTSRSERIRSVAVAPNGGYAIVGDKSFVCSGLPLYLQKKVNEMKAAGEFIRSIAIAPNGEWVIVGNKSWFGSNPTSELYNRIVQKSKQGSEFIQAVVIAPNGGYLIIGNKTWSSSNVPEDLSKKLQDFARVGKSIEAAVFTVEGNWIVY